MPAADITIRGERGGDRDGIGEVHRLAFAGGAEARLVDDLRRSGDAVISLVAECAGAIVGHVCFSRLEAPLRALALAPLAVWPERQGQGIGSALVHAGLEQADRGAWEAVFVLGAPRFYERFGFSAETAKGFSCPYRGEEFMARFRGVEAASRAGRLGYPLAFGALEA